MDAGIKICICVRVANTKTHKEFLRAKVTPEPISLCLCGNLFLDTVFLDAVEFFFLSQACWESANHYRRQQISPASGYIF